jgi:L-ornithine Nalpha-acyltransferase
MRVDRLASAEARKPQDVSWTPEWLARYFVAAELRKSRQKLSPLRLGAIGKLEVSLTRDKREVKRLQKLRYKVFYEHRRADIVTRFMQRDRDYFDGICDHLMVVDRSVRSLTGRSPVIGTYRLLRQDVAEKHGGFYSAEEFDISSLLRRHAGLRFLELGRSCVLPPYRTKRTIELLWHGVWRYVQEQHVDVMMGCASFEGTDIALLSRPLSFLHHFARAPEAWCCGAHPFGRVEMNRIPKDEINVKAAWDELPPLIKGYLRVGAFVGDGAVIDAKLGTTDVLTIMPVSAIRARYVRYFGAGARYAG